MCRKRADAKGELRPVPSMATPPGAVEKAMLVGCLILVLAAEILNSAIEAVVDKTTPEFHELAGRAKDMGSAAVFLLMLNVALCWGLILWQHATT